MSTLLILVSAVIAAVAGYIISSIHSRKYRYPPGPKTLPIIGNIHQLPQGQLGKWAEGLAKEYGEMFTIKIGGQRWVFLSSTRTIKDLLEKRAAIYSSRPPMPMLGDTMSGGKRILLMPYNDLWRSARKIMHQLLTSKAVEAYRPFQDIESRQLLWDYLHDPDKFYIHNARYANSVIMSVVFGRRTRGDDKYVRMMFETAEEFLTNFVPGAYLCDSFPILGKLPKFLQWWRPAGERAYQKTVGAYRGFYKDFAKSMENGTASECFATKLFAAADQYDFDQDQQMFIAGSLIEAGSDTTRNQNNLLIAAAAVYPEWVAKARKQLDDACGHNAERLPDWQDWEKVPYMQAVIKETLRWRANGADTGVPRTLIKDDEYEGYFFEKGTVFTTNSWANHLDPKEHEDPLTFYPDRYLDEHLWDVLQGHWGFGVGRRVCVGWNVGLRNMWMVFSRLLYCYDFIQDLNEPIDTMNIPPQTKGLPPYKITIKPRSEAHRQLILRECKASNDDLRRKS